MDRRRAAGALLALAACIATTAAAPTASNHTALDLYDEHTEGCYYNFQHYGEGDRIMTNEPCLNCTCHNRMLMCYLRVCPFTKAIGQDCTVEKRADQCCPIVTCPDVPVDLLTSTSTSSPAEYGGTGVGKVDNYGCTLNGKYFPEGSKVPGTPNKPCEHCYCIRNMTTCVMQECTLHVDGCTPIYHKDVCCPVRYFCDHPEDEIPLLDDMTTTVRPTPGFLLTTIAPTEITTTPPPARKDCIENGQLYEDGALIKTEKPCEHCYCMKGDIVCVVQECGTPMENEGKNCTSVPPRAGHCCPDTYICEGDEFSPEPTTDVPFEESTTMIPSRRVSVEGSGYRNDDEITLMPTFATEIEGSGEEEIPERPLSTSQPDLETTELDEKLGPTEQGEFIPKTTQTSVTDEIEKSTTEPNKDLNTVPSDLGEGESTESSVNEETILPDQTKITEPSVGEEITTPSIIEKVDTSGLPPTEKDVISEIETKPTGSTLPQEQSTSVTATLEEESTELSIKETTSKTEEKVTESPVLREDETPVTSIKPSVTEMTETSTVMDGFKSTEQPLVTEQEQATTTPIEIVHEESSEPSVAVTSTTEESKLTTTSLVTDKENEIYETDLKETKQTSAKGEESTEKMATVGQETTPSEEIRTEPTVLETTTPRDKLDVTEPALISEQNTVPESTASEGSTEPSVYDKTTAIDLETPIITQQETVTSAIPKEESSEPSILEKTTEGTDLETTKLSIEEEEQPHKVESSTNIPKIEEEAVTTESPLKQGDESTAPTEGVTQKDTDIPTTVEMDITKEIITPSTDILSSEAPIAQHELELTTTQIPELVEAEKTTQLKETTTESIMELSTFAHVDDKESPSSNAPESEISPTTSVPEKQDVPEATTINPEDNEIDEEQSPGRIPGEGDCLLEGVTYKNDSVVPSSNKCHSGCKCVSSIIKCDPIICSPQPEYMDNCQLRYDTPESCCPTYVCDHSKETIPPQPHSQMSGTESPMQTTSVECNGDQCGATDGQQPTTEPSKTPERIGDTDCGSNDCDNTQSLLTQTPEGCIGNECTQQADSCTDGKCELPLPPTKEQPQEIPSKEISETCENPEDCKSIQVTTPCENESCTTIQEQPCDKEGGCETPAVSSCEGENCEIKPDLPPVTPDKDTSICKDQEDCKEIKEVQPQCEGDSCTVAPESTTSKEIPLLCENEADCKRIEKPDSAAEVKDDCSHGDCKITTSPPSEEDLCDGQVGCKTPEKTSADCKDGKCAERQGEDKLQHECNGDECMQQEPVSPTQATTYPESLSTNIPVSEQTASPSFVTKEGEEHPTIIEAATTLSEEAVTPEPKVTEQPEKHIPGYETSVADEEDKVTKASTDGITTVMPDLTLEGSGQPLDEEEEIKKDITTEVSAIEPLQENVTTTPKSEVVNLSTDNTESPVTEVTPQKETETKPISAETESPVQVTESQEKQTEKPEEPSDEVRDTSTTKLPEEDHYETPTEIPDLQVTKTEDVTKEPEVHKGDENQATTISGLPVTEYEKTTDKPGKQTEEELIETSTSEILRIETTEKISELSKSTEASTEPEVSITEASIHEDSETKTKQPDITVETETEKQEMATKSPLDHKHQTTTISFEATPDQETTSVGQEKTEAPTVEVTTAHEILITSEITEEVPAKLPERFGDKEDDSVRTTMIPELEQTKTKAPELMDITETVTQKSDESDIQTTEIIATEQKVPQPHITEAQTESVTEILITTTPQSTGELDTTAPETVTSVEDKIGTETPLSHVTESEQIEVTTPQAPVSEFDVTQPEIDRNEEEKFTTEKPELHEPEQMGTELPLVTQSEPEKTITEASHSLITEQDTTTEKENEIIPEKNSEDTDKQETGTMIPVSTVAVPVEHIATDQQEASTKGPFITEVPSSAEDKATESSYETESPFGQPHEETTSAPMLPSTSEKEITIVSDDKQPSVTEEYEMSTEEPKQTYEDGYTPTKHEIVTEAPEVYNTDVMPSELPTGIPQMPEDEKVTTKPEEETMIGSSETVTGATEGPKLETEIPSSSTETHDTIKPTVIEKDTTGGPETSITSTEQESTTASPIEFTTKETLREGSETTKLEETSTDAPDLSDIEQENVSTQSPQKQETDEQETRKEESPTTTMSEIPSKVTYTESPATLETSEPDKPAIDTTEYSDIPTSQFEQGHEDKETEQAEKTTERSQEASTEKLEVTETEPEIVDTKETESTDSAPIEPQKSTEYPTEISTKTPVPESTEDREIMPQETISTSKPELEHSETTPYLVELEEHTHKIDEELSTISPSDEPTTSRVEEESGEPQVTIGSTESVPSDEKQTQIPPVERDQPEKEGEAPSTEGPQTTLASPEEAPERTTEPSFSDIETTPGVISLVPSKEHGPDDKYGGVSEQDKEQESTTPTQISEEKEPITSTPSVEKETAIVETPEKPQDIPVDTTAPEEEFIAVTTTSKITTAKVEEETTTQSAETLDKFTKPEEKPIETIPSTSLPEVSKPDELPPTDEALHPEEESHFPPSGMGGYNQEPDYGEEDQAFGPGTCRYGGKVYVSAQQIPRDDPCDFCFCFRSDIICLQQSCPPPIHGCHEEPIQGFCCPRYECPVSMATTLNVTTTTTTTTTTLPPHFLPHAYKGAAQRRGCQIKGHTYKVGEVVRASSGPCLHCTCGGDGQMKCDPKACTPEPMLRQMIAAAVSAKRRR